MQFGNTNYYLYLVVISTGINWAYTDKKQADRARLAMQQKSKKVKPNVKPKTQTYKVKELVWFISPVGHNVVPSPMEDVIRNILNGFEIEFATEVSFKGLNPKGGIGGNFVLLFTNVYLYKKNHELYEQANSARHRHRCIRTIALGAQTDSSRVHNMPAFLNANNLQPFVGEDLTGVLNKVEYIDQAGNKNEGFQATILPMLCKVYLDARRHGC